MPLLQTVERQGEINEAETVAPDAVLPVKGQSPPDAVLVPALGTKVSALDDKLRIA